MKKGGIHDINGFISLPKEKSTRSKKSDKDVIKARTSSLIKPGLEITPKSKVKQVVSVPTNKNTIHTAEGRENHRDNSSSSSFDASTRDLKANRKSSSVIEYKGKESRQFSDNVKLIENDVKDKTKRLHDTKIKTKMKAKNSVLEDRREVSSSRITMNDVYKTKIKITSDRRSSVANTKTNDSSTEDIAYDGNQKVTIVENKEANIITEAMRVCLTDENLNNEDYEYEDDFEEYESDFESYTSNNSSGDSGNECSDSALDDSKSKTGVTQEKQMDSGNYDVSSSSTPYSSLGSAAQTVVTHKLNPQIEAIKEALHKENAMVRQITIQSKKPEETVIEKDIEDKFTSFQSRSLLNFSSAKKRQQNMEKLNKIKARGEKLLGMIKLNTITYSLYTRKPVPYETFMKSFAHKNTIQAYTQTNEDNLSEEIQTEDVVYKTKWIQCPPSFKKHELEVVANVPQLMLGVGDDGTEQMPIQKLLINTVKLERFVKFAGQIILATLDEDARFKDAFNNKRIGADFKCDLDITDNYAVLNNFDDITILRDRPVIRVSFSSNDPNKLLSIHGFPKSNAGDECYNRYVICVWNIFIPSRPSNILASCGVITRACFAANDSSYVLAGHQDGIICVWDLREKSLHQFIDFETSGDTDLLLRAPAYTTAELRRASHMKSIIDIGCVPQESEHGNWFNLHLAPTLFCSVDEDGILIVWTVSRNTRKTLSESGLAPWSKLRVFISHYVDISSYMSKSFTESVRITCMKLVSEYCIYVGTDDGCVFQFSLYGGPNYVKVYTSLENSDPCRVSCIEESPLDEKRFMVGYTNGRIMLYDRSFKKPLIQFVVNFDLIACSVVCIKWLWHDPNYVIVLDSLNRVSVFDVTRRINPYPVYCKSLSSDPVYLIEQSAKTNAGKCPYLVLLFESGRIQLEKLKNNLLNIFER